MSAAHKPCNKCGTVRPVDEFNRDKRLSDGRRNTCRDCVRAASAAWRAANVEHRKAYNQRVAQGRKTYQREWRAANPERVRAYRATQAERAQSDDFLTAWRKCDRLTHP